MFATHPPSLLFHSSSAPTAGFRSVPCSRPALADSTNSRSHACAGYPKGIAYPTSNSRTGCANWNDFEHCIASTSTSPHPHHPQPSHSSSSHTPSPFQVTYKAPPTVSISLSAACSQSIPGDLRRGSRVQGSEPDLPDVKSVVPFPSATLASDVDVDMLDGTCVPCPDGRLAGPRKRRSAHSSIVSQSSLGGKDTKPKRPRKSKRQVAELWWLGVIQRSIVCFIEARNATGMPDASDSNRLLGDLDMMDRALVERIQRRLVKNGCGEGRAFPNPLPQISSPSMSVPSVNLSVPSRKTLPNDSGLSPELNAKKKDGADGITTTSSSCVSSSVPSRSYLLPSPTSLSQHRCHVRFEISQPPPPRPRVPRNSSHPASVPRRSPSPPARTGLTVAAANAPTLTLTMPQLVASLTLAYRERKSVNMRGRTCKITVMECGKNAGHSSPSLPSVPSQSVQCHSDGDLAPRARLWSTTPERRSPLSRVAYVES